MKNVLSLLGLASASLIANTAFASVACTATQTFTPNINYSASYTVCGGSLLSVTVTANTTGWVGLGFSSDQLMTNTDIVTGGIDSVGSVYVADRFATSRTAPTLDANQDVTAISQTSNETNGITTLTFTRALNTGDTAGDYNLASGSYYLLWSYGAADTFSKHTARGASALAYNFSGAAVPLPAATWLFASSMVGIMGLRRASKVKN